MDGESEGRTIDLDRPGSAAVGATHGEVEVEIGPPGDHPDHAEVTVRAVGGDGGDGGDRDDADGSDGDDADGVVLSVDVAAGDHGTGHADVTLTPEEVRALRAALGESVE